ncbi:membrane fusion protein (multidrug efflux system) [Stella humosa]|uniref:Membrane fusion protein (Multidrug efflux system) n=1 Tax=Stella humosa TaxID=94 RepID=A0A3N1KY53_9PROT|nr:efflux RND transporter periplasmic adaptor subunit [Stella humosa]ROP83520.1 membrane fusion protein (multidrug efflux system) [Stella humosa]BBK33207.1 RND transporter MFP subunit [Stella humosa]
MTALPHGPAGRIGAAAILLAIAGILLAARPAGAQPAPPGAPPPAVVVAAAEKRPLTRSFPFVGRVQALDKVELRSRIQGFLQRRLFEEGAVVKEGDLLFVIEKAPFEAAVAQQRAGLAVAQAGAQNATVQLARARELSRTQNIPQATVDQRAAEDAQARARVMEAQASLRDAEINLGYTDIKAPLDGRIGKANFTVGAFLGPDSGALATIVREEPMTITFSVPQRMMVEAQRSGLANEKFVVRAILADGKPYAHPGAIDFVDVLVDRRTDSLAIRARFPNPDRMLVDGQAVRVAAETTTPEEAVMIPQAAIQQDQSGAFALVVGAGDRVEIRRVKTGTVDTGWTAVESGIAAGDRVIVQGVQRVRPGQVVAPTVAPPAPRS